MNLRALRRPLFGALLLWVSSCTRTAPDGTGPDDPTDTTMLVPIATYDLGPSVTEPSGLVYDARSDAFIVVSDSHPELYWVDRRGALQRTVTTAGTDLEGISLSASGDTVYLAEERNRVIDSYRRDGTLLSSFPADVATLPNNALEGVSSGPGGRLFVLNEKAPGMLLEYAPNGTELKRTVLSFASDYSDVMFDSVRNALWIVSDESRKLFRTDLSGSVQASWSLPFAKGEGISIVHDTLYIVNDADARMYLFSLPH